MQEIFTNFLLVNSDTSDSNELKKNFDYLLTDFTYIINHSLIEGKYIQNNQPEKFETILQEFLINIQFETNYDQKLIEKYTNVFNYILHYYSLFYYKTVNLYSRNIIEFVDRDIYKDIYHITFKNFKDLIKITELNIELSKLDHQFVNDLTLLKNLFRIKNNLRVIRLLPESFSDQIKHENFIHLRDSIEFKVDFLIDKWYLRSKTKLLNFNSQINNFKHTATNLSVFDSIKFRNFRNKIIYIYDIQGYNCKNLLDSDFIKIDKNNFNNLNCFELHTLIKYYKDSENSNIDEFDKITKAFKNKLIKCDTNNTFEYFSYSIAYQYSINNYYSLFCDKFIEEYTNIDSSKIVDSLNLFYKKYKEIKESSTNLTDNFFLEYKFLENSLNLLNIYLKTFNNYEIIDSTKYFFERIKSILKKYQTNLSWSLKNNNYIFQLPYNESKIPFNKDINIYFSSSFLLPKVNEDILIEKRKIETLFQEVNTIYNIEKQILELKEIKDLNQKLQEDYKADNKKLIETVTVFTAIISFIVGSIGAFKFIETFSQAILFITIYSICISIFVLLIFTSTKGVQKLKEFSIYIIITYALLLIFLGIFALPFYNQDLKNKSTYTKSQLDSINKSNNDSIKELNKKLINIQNEYKISQSK